MKFSKVVILVFTITGSVFSKSDSLKFKNFRGFYLNSYYASYQGGTYIPDQGLKFPDTGEEYHYDFKKYSYQTPAIGIGYVLNKHPFFIKTDINYWFGSIQLDEKIISKWTTDDQLIYIPWPGSSPYPIGFRYYKNTDYIKGYLNVNNFDISFLVSGNITRNFRIYYGWRINFLVQYSFMATMNRESSLYEVVAWTSPYTSRDSLIVTGYQEYKNKAVKDKSIYSLSRKGYFDFGICYNFRIRKELFIAEVQYELSHFPFQLYSPRGLIYDCYTAKLAYVFNYSTYFGNKKSKD